MLSYIQIKLEVSKSRKRFSAARLRTDKYRWTFVCSFLLRFEDSGLIYWEKWLFGDQRRWTLRLHN